MQTIVNVTSCILNRSRPPRGEYPLENELYHGSLPALSQVHLHSKIYAYQYIGLHRIELQRKIIMA